VIHQRRERCPVIVDTQQDDRLGVKPKLAPGQHLEEFIQRSGPAGQHHDGIGIHQHDLLALMHGFGDDEPCQIGLADLQFQKMRRNHSERVSARVLGRPCNGAHQADIARAIDQAPAGFGDGAPKGLCLAGISRILPRT